MVLQKLTITAHLHGRNRGDASNVLFIDWSILIRKSQYVFPGFKKTKVLSRLVFPNEGI